MGLYEELIQNRKAKLLPGGAAQNTARGAQVRHLTFLFACSAATWDTWVPRRSFTLCLRSHGGRIEGFMSKRWSV